MRAATAPWPARRVQLRGVKGWRKPAHVVVVARPTKWGNPFTTTYAREEFGSRYTDPELRLLLRECFRDWLTRGPASEWWFLESAAHHAWIVANLHELAGRDLGCWCPIDQACHADVLLELANPGVGHHERAAS